MRRLIIIAALNTWVASVSAITVQVDYTYDTGFFTGNAAAQTAVEKAASDLGAAITSSLSAVSNDMFVGNNGNAMVSLDWSLYIDDPSNLASEVEFTSFGGLFPQNTIRMYVGGSALGSSTLGIGGPASGGYGLSASTSGSPYGPAFVSAVNQSNSELGRGGGPTIGSLDESLGGVDATLSYGAIGGYLSINSGKVWHFDINTLPNPGEFDLYSVALHEMMHAIGFSSGADSWVENRSGNDWLGPEVISLTAGGIGVLTPGSAHIAAGTMSPRISDGVLQDAIMVPAIGDGERRELTELDLAFLRDLGYATVPEPEIFALLALAAVVLAGRRWLARRA